MKQPLSNSVPSCITLILKGFHPRIRGECELIIRKFIMKEMPAWEKGIVLSSQGTLRCSIFLSMIYNLLYLKGYNLKQGQPGGN